MAFPAGKILPYSAALDRPERPYPFAARHGAGNRQLVFIAARHEFDLDSPTHRLIDEVMANFKPKAVIVEGMETTSPTGWDAEIEHYYLEQARQIQIETPGQMPESYHTLLRAKAAGAIIFSGEPAEPAQRAHVKTAGYSADEYAALMFLWTIAHWRAQGIAAGELPAIWARLYQHHHAHLSPRLTTDFASFTALFFDIAHIPFRLDLIDSHFVAPDIARPRGSFGHQAGILSLFRDITLLGVIADALRHHGHVLAVYGGSHYGSLEPALQAGFALSEE